MGVSESKDYIPLMRKGEPVDKGKHKWVSMNIDGDYWGKGISYWIKEHSKGRDYVLLSKMLSYSPGTLRVISDIHGEQIWDMAEREYGVEGIYRMTSEIMWEYLAFYNLGALVVQISDDDDSRIMTEGMMRNWLAAFEWKHKGITYVAYIQYNLVENPLFDSWVEYRRQLRNEEEQGSIFDQRTIHRQPGK